MFFVDLAWFMRGFFARYRFRASDIRAHLIVPEGDIRLRARRSSFASVLICALPFAVARIDGISGGASFGPAASLALPLWILSVTFYLFLSFIGPRIRQPTLAHVSAPLASLPFGIACLAVGAQSLHFLVAIEASTSLGVSLLLITIALLLGVPSGLSQFSRRLSRRRYKSWLRRSDGNWSPTFELHDWRSTRVSCFVIASSVLATPLGLNLARITGRANANVILAALMASLGVSILYGSLRTSLVFAIALNTISRQRGIALRLPDYSGEPPQAA